MISSIFVEVHPVDFATSSTYGGTRITDATLTSTMPWQMATLRHRGTVVSIKRCQPICEESLHARRPKKRVDCMLILWKILEDMFDTDDYVFNEY